MSVKRTSISSGRRCTYSLHLHVTPGNIFAPPLTHTQKPFRSQQKGFAVSLVQSDVWAQTCSVSVALQLVAKLVEQPATHLDENDCVVQFGGFLEITTTECSGVLLVTRNWIHAHLYLGELDEQAGDKTSA